ncbi:hypothetical protein V8V91_12230 [Algoriphagus halophilus]
MKKLIYLILFSALLSSCSSNDDLPEIKIEIASDLGQDISDGRLLLFFSKDESREPRFSVSDNVNTAQVFGMDVESFEPGSIIEFKMDSFGYPLEQLSNLEEGNYLVQAFFIKYETFERADGHQVKLAMDQGEGRKWASTPGNIYSFPSPLIGKKGAIFSLLSTKKFLR